MKQLYADPVRGIVCSWCGFAVSLPPGTGPARQLPLSVVDAAIKEVQEHIKTAHWLNNIPGTKDNE